MKKISIYTAALFGLDAKIISIEIASSRSLPGIEIIGLPGNSIKESKARITSACKYIGLTRPPQKILINLAPGDLKKEGTQYDVPIFVSLLLLLLGVKKVNKTFLHEALFFGEISLDGSVKKIQGLLPLILSAKEIGWKKFVVPEENIEELILVEGVEFYPVKSIIALKNMFEGVSLKKSDHKINKRKRRIKNYDTIQGHAYAKRALQIAAYGQHNILLIGSPGTGKTILAEYLRKLFPPLNTKQCLDVWKINSLVGNYNYTTERPFIHVTNGTTKTTLLGGGVKLLPGLLSQAHRGVLFLDEICEFKANIIDSLREPMQNKVIKIKRSSGSIKYPANCLIVGAMNPCRCGFYNTKEGLCVCSEASVKKYQSRLSGPIRDRFDIIIEIQKQPVEKTLMSKKSIINNKDIVSIWKKQIKRNNGHLNGTISPTEILRKGLITIKAKNFLIETSKKQKLSTRVSHKVVMIARTIADIDSSRLIELRHISEAIQYRSLSLFIDL